MLDFSPPFKQKTWHIQAFYSADKEPTVSDCKSHFTFTFWLFSKQNIIKGPWLEGQLSSPWDGRGNCKA